MLTASKANLYCLIYHGLYFDILSTMICLHSVPLILEESVLVTMFRVILKQTNLMFSDVCIDREIPYWEFTFIYTRMMLWRWIVHMTLVMHLGWGKLSVMLYLMLMGCSHSHQYHVVQLYTYASYACHIMHSFIFNFCVSSVTFKFLNFSKCHAFTFGKSLLVFPWIQAYYLLMTEYSAF